MTAMPDKCPRCGSPHKERWGCADHFQCGSYIRLFDRRFRDSEGCVRRQLEAARAETDRLRQMIGECHLMISRGTDEFQTKHDWEATDLPKRLQSVMRKNAALWGALRSLVHNGTRQTVTVSGVPHVQYIPGVVTMEQGRIIEELADLADAGRLGAELTSAVLENERLRSVLQRLYEDTVTPEVGCHRCAGAAGAHDEGCAMAEVEAVLGVEVPQNAGD